MNSSFATLLIVLSLSFSLSNSLECYSGTAVVRGQSVGTAKVTCKDATDQCYKASAEASPMAKLKKAGCSTIYCSMSRDKCSEQLIAGQTLQICCCSTDLCNSKKNGSGVSDIQGMLGKLQGFAALG